ncbi:hypothetical protein D0C36_05880 [Mucilaginibacter conchicola]|uniref:DUF2768 domain-containing protein n=1 Tax=Mucilaginibacter conchicola TaxID=2303333 RepID=A0A372NYT3_9SPHI|nr:hypothetical protein [Mucilaginibacter conchicola]RFZ95054.1 hypothetical protein D0C36_05880 [Mucilaginibacter conchicola]
MLYIFIICYISLLVIGFMATRKVMDKGMSAIIYAILFIGFAAVSLGLAIVLLSIFIGVH